MKREKAIELISALLVLLFTYAALSKLLIFKTFQLQLSQSPVLSRFALPISWAVLIIEGIAVLLLLFKQSRSSGLYLSFFLLFSFSAYIFSMLQFSHTLPCSCGGIISQLNWQQHLIFNIVYTLLALTGIALQAKTSKGNTSQVNYRHEAENLYKKVSKPG